MARKGRKILVAVDEGDESSYALSWCLNNLIYHHNSQDTLILLFAKTPVAVYSATDSTGYMYASSVITTIERYANHVADKVVDKASSLICKHLNTQVQVEMMMEVGDPRDVICEVAHRLKVDFLVMGMMAMRLPWLTWRIEIEQRGRSSNYLLLLIYSAIEFLISYFLICLLDLFYLCWVSWA